MQSDLNRAGFWLQMIVGVFLACAGLAALIYGRYDLDGVGISLSGLLGRRNEVLDVIFAVIELLPVCCW